MTNPKLHTTSDQSRIVAPIMQRLGVEEDAYYDDDGDLRIVFEIETYCEMSPTWTPAYRLDRLFLILPEWVFTWRNNIWQYLKHEIKRSLTTELMTEIHELCLSLNHLRGQEAIAACVELIVLLDKEGLL